MPEITTLGAVIKATYEAEANTNAFTDAEKAKLSGIENGAQVNAVTSVNGSQGDVVVDKSDVGLGNVDNTSDEDKPISDDTQAALDLKVSSDITGYAGAGVITNEISCTQAQYDVYAAAPPANFSTTKFVITDD